MDLSLTSISMDEHLFFLHFTGPDDIRDVKAIGESGPNPVFFEFDTDVMQYQPGNVTEVNLLMICVKSTSHHI